ncbi:MAG TPA: hypothetical protein VFO29_11955 [Candidatus Rubrimentiphilum sp.]|nr:hypothetical protein [Candidatus Rubrimentiphilum sp.]
MRLAASPNGTTAPDAFEQAVASGDRVTKEAYQNLARRLVHRGVLVADSTVHPIRYKIGQNVDGQWLEEEDLASMVNDEYPLLTIPVWRESMRQIQHVPEEWWAFLRSKLANENARDLFARAIISYCDDLAALIESQVDAIDNGADQKDLIRNAEEGRNAVLLLHGLVRFGLGLSTEAVTLPPQFEQAVQERRKNPASVPVRHNEQQLRTELAWRIEDGPFVTTAIAEHQERMLLGAVDGSSRTGVMSFLGEDSDFYVGHAPMITVNTAIGQMNRRVRFPKGEEHPAFARLPEKPEDMQQRENRYTVMAKIFFPDLSDAEYMHALWNGMDVLETRTTLRVLSRWYTNPGSVEMPPADVVLRDGTVVPQDRDFSHYRNDTSAGKIVRDMIELNWEIAKKCRDDEQTVAGIVKAAQLRVFGPVINWYVAQQAALKNAGPVEAWPMRALNSVADQMLLTRLLTACRTQGQPWSRTALVIRPFHATTNFAKRYSVNEPPIELIEKLRKLETNAAEYEGAFGRAVFWDSFRGPADPYVQMLRNVAYASCYIATIPRLEVERFLPRVEFILHADVYGDSDPHPQAQSHLKRVLSGLEQSGFEVSEEHSMFRDKSTLEVLPELVARAHDTVKIWAHELVIRLDEYLTTIIGRHVSDKRSRGIRVRPFSKQEFVILHQALESERRRLSGSGPQEIQS